MGIGSEAASVSSGPVYAPNGTRVSAQSANPSRCP